MIGSISFNLIANSYMSEFSFEQNKKVSLKRWMKGKCYHKRINKKLLKKYGGENKRHFIRTGNNIVAHPNTIKLISESIGGE